ncbi:MAG TPA: apolipoprotein N-acyltransferase [Aggregicoccus sp.]|nr:apolipoprotein N-acyltransferase [Aggregicoccus sp.]
MRRAAAAVLLSTALLAGYSRLVAPSHLLGLVCLVPFLAALERARSFRGASLLGAAQAVGFSLAALGWFPAAVERYSGDSPWLVGGLLLLGAPLMQPQFLALAWVRWALARRGAGPGCAALGGALAYVGAEWAVPRLLDGSLGYGLYPAEALRQAADVAGVRGLTLALVLANEALWALWRDRALWRTRRWALGRAVTLALPLALAGGYGTWQLARAERPAAGTAALRVGLVQSNLTHYAALAEQLGTYDAARTILDTHYALSRELLHAGAPELIIWPETAYPTTFGAPKSEAGAELDAELRAFSADARVPLLFGAYASDGAREFNAAVLLASAADGAAQTYRKARPFPLTEYVPPLLDGPRVRALLPWLGTWSPGPGAALLTLPRAGGTSVRLLPLICYDVTDPGLVAAAARQGAEAIVTLANDAWFVGTLGSRQHLVVAAFRSVETRLPQVRATTSGISAEIDAWGRITRSTDEDRRQVLRASLATGAQGRTLVVRWGDWLGGVALAGVALLLGVRWRRGA